MCSKSAKVDKMFKIVKSKYLLRLTKCYKIMIHFQKINQFRITEVELLLCQFSD